MGDDRDLKVLAAAGRKIEAIRLYRDRYNVGLKEAKDVVESWFASEPPRATAATAKVAPAPPAATVRSDSSFAEEITRLVRANQKIQAIKVYRDWKPVGLKEAKDAIDAWPVMPEAAPSSLSAAPKSPAPPAAPSPPAMRAEPEELAFSPGTASVPAVGNSAEACEGHIDDRNLGQAIDLALRMGRRDEAIQIYQDRYGVGRGEAEKVIDARTTSTSGVPAKSGCFIATAAYGSVDAPEVEALRRFRDRVLLPSPIGRRFVYGYYRLSPPIAARVSGSSTARTCVRAVLKPLAELCRLLISLSPKRSPSHPSAPLQGIREAALSATSPARPRGRESP
jgi:ribosomal protein L7/L12